MMSNSNSKSIFYFALFMLVLIILSMMVGQFSSMKTKIVAMETRTDNQLKEIQALSEKLSKWGVTEESVSEPVIEEKSITVFRPKDY